MSASDRNIVWHQQEVNRAHREAVLNQRGRLVWFTGLSGSGKSTVAVRLEAHLNSMGFGVYLLDGDNLRHGLNSDLGFGPADRRENIRRIGEMAHVIVDAGLVVITAAISPYRADRDANRARYAPGDFIEVWVRTPIEVCEQRDPKGLYRKARAGVIPDFTGVSAPYEEPANPEVTIDTSTMSIDACVEAVWEYMEPGMRPVRWPSV